MYTILLEALEDNRPSRIHKNVDSNQIQSLLSDSMNNGSSDHTITNIDKFLTDKTIISDDNEIKGTLVKTNENMDNALIIITTNLDNPTSPSTIVISDDINYINTHLKHTTGDMTIDPWSINTYSDEKDSTEQLSYFYRPKPGTYCDTRQTIIPLNSKSELFTITKDRLVEMSMNNLNTNEKTELKDYIENQSNNEIQPLDLSGLETTEQNIN